MKQDGNSFFFEDRKCVNSNIIAVTEKKTKKTCKQ